MPRAVSGQDIRSRRNAYQRFMSGQMYGTLATL